LNVRDTDRGTPAPAASRRAQAGVLQWIEYAGFRLVAAIAASLPLDVASSVSGRIWRFVAPMLRRHARARANIAASLPELSEQAREAILLDMWENLGRTFGEAFHLQDLAAARDRVTIDLSPEVESLLRKGGVVLVSLHLGNWEIAVTSLAPYGLDAAGVYQSLKNPIVDDYVTGMRGPLYKAGLFSTVFKLMRVVRAGKSVAILADQREHRGISVPFFGRPAPSNPFPAILARSQKVPLVAGYVLRTTGAHFVVRGEVVDVPQTGDREADVAAATANIHAVFERWIRQHPGQWMWGHRRWG
jgi:KDO2-lipid IV(A) lauroyltransferase